jgi:hypothetical protein
MATASFLQLTKKPINGAQAQIRMQFYGITDQYKELEFNNSIVRDNLQ